MKSKINDLLKKNINKNIINEKPPNLINNWEKKPMFYKWDLER